MIFIRGGQNYPKTEPNRTKLKLTEPLIGY